MISNPESYRWAPKAETSKAGKDAKNTTSAGSFERGDDKRSYIHTKETSLLFICCEFLHTTVLLVRLVQSIAYPTFPIIDG